MTTQTIHLSPGSLRIAMLSIHSSPIGPLGTQNTGGMSVYVRELAKWLGDNGHQIDIFTNVRGDDQQLAANVQLIHLARAHDPEIDKDRLPAYLPQVFHAMDRHRHAMGRKYDVIHSHYWLSGVVGAMAQARWYCPHLMMFHTLAMAKNNTRSSENESALRIAHELWLAKTIDHIVVPTLREMENLIRYYHAQPSKISVIPCGVNLERFSPMDRLAARQQLGWPSQSPVVLYVGRFAPLKGIDQLVRAVSNLLPRFPDLQLVIVGGDGAQSQATRDLVDLAERLNLGRHIRLAGSLDQTLLPVYYNAADLLALPSHYESFGLVVLEAMACGTPVVATPVGVVETILQEGLNGKLIAGPEEQKVTQAIAWMLDRLSHNRPSQAKIRSTITSFDWRHIAAGVADTYAAMIKVHDPAQELRFYEGCGVFSN